LSFFFFFFPFIFFQAHLDERASSKKNESLEPPLCFHFFSDSSTLSP